MLEDVILLHVKVPLLFYAENFLLTQRKMGNSVPEVEKAWIASQTSLRFPDRPVGGTRDPRTG